MTAPNPWEDVKQVLGDGPDASRRLRQRARVLDGLQTRSSGRRRLVLALAGVAVVAALAVVLLRPAPAVREADGTLVTPGAVLVADAPRELNFSEGSRLVLEPQTRARVDAVDSSHVEVVIETGRIDAEVTKGTGRTWRYHAGAWTVRVVGTRLSVAWKPTEEAIDVHVTEGAVEVSGPGLTAPVLVRAGESLSRRAREAVIPTAPVEATAREELPEVDLSDGDPVITRVPAAPAPKRPTVIAPPVASGPGWKELLAAGKRREALDQATTDGVFARSDQLADADALALADAARVERRADLARQLLSEVLARNGADAAEAAFLLGRLEGDAHKPGSAATFFRRAVQLAPEGAFAEQSRGRLMEALLELEDLAAARTVAVDYLRHHPAGAWAGLAGKLVAGDAGQ